MLLANNSPSKRPGRTARPLGHRPRPLRGAKTRIHRSRSASLPRAIPGACARWTEKQRGDNSLQKREFRSGGGPALSEWLRNALQGHFRALSGESDTSARARCQNALTARSRRSHFAADLRTPCSSAPARRYRAICWPARAPVGQPALVQLVQLVQLGGGVPW